MTADRPTRDGEEQHGGIAYLDHIAATSTNPVLLRAVAETRAELAAAVAARPAGQERCICDGGSYETKAHPFLVHPDCPVHRPAAPSSPGTGQVREEIAAELARHGSTMDYRWDDEEHVRLGCSCGHEWGLVDKEWLAANLTAHVLRGRVHVADAVLSLSSLRRLLDTAAAVERVTALAEDDERVVAIAREKEAAAKVIGEQNYWHTLAGVREQSASRLRSALDGDQP